MGGSISCLGINSSRNAYLPGNRPAYRRANNQLPFILDKVPEEIILAILHAACDRASLQGHLRYVRMLSSVCATWRRWVLEDSSFWAQIYVSGQPALHDLCTALTNSRTRPIEIGVDLTSRSHAIGSEHDTHSATAVITLINAHLWRTIALTLIIDARLFDAVHLLRSPASSLERLTISVRTAETTYTISPQVPHFLSEAMPKLTRLSVYGVPYPIFHAALVPSLRVVEFHPRKLSYSEFAGMFRACPLLEEVFIRDLYIYARTGEALPPARSIVAAHLRSLCIEGVHSLGTDVVTAQALYTLTLERISTMALTGVTGRPLGIAEARACLGTLGALGLHALEFSREVLEDDELHSVGIATTAPGGMERRVHVFVPSVDVPAVVRMTHGTGAPRTVRHLTVPADWAPAFLRHTDLALDELRTLTLTYNLGPGDLETALLSSPPARPPTACALLEEVTVAVADSNVIPKLLPLLHRVLASIIAIDADGRPHSATLVLSRSFSHSPGQTGRRYAGLGKLKALFRATRTL